jgi:diacylglycerol kinase
VTRPGGAGTRRGWGRKFAEAFRGIGLVARYESSFRIHLLASAAVLTLAAILRCEAWEWCAVLGCIGLVATAEVLNTALETLFHALDDATKQRMSGCLDRAAGAVLLASITSATIGAIVFVRKFAG